MTIGGGVEGRVAGAPISWGVCEVPGWGHQMRPERVLSEMASVGLRATEAGPDGYLPTDPAAMAELLGSHGLDLVGGFLPLRLHDEDDQRWRAQLAEVADRFAAAGGDVVVLAAAADREGYDAPAELADAEWRTLLAQLEATAELAAARGLSATLHPHVGTVVERPEHVERVLAGSRVPLCWDTGHVMAGGGDPLDVPRRVPERIGHVHLKDVDARLARSVAARELAYSEAVARGLYRPLGAGDAGIAELPALLQRAGYTGWFVLEQDTALEAEPPRGSGPVQQVRQSLEFLRAIASTRD